MADGKKKEPLSLNQLHDRFLHDLSVSQSQHRSRSLGTIVDDDSTGLNGSLDDSLGSSRVNLELPRFDLSTPSPPVHGMINIADGGNIECNRTVGTQVMHIESDDNEEPEKEDDIAYRNPPFYDVADSASRIPGEERQVKVKIEGRRRLCKISKNDDYGLTRKNMSREKEPQVVAISDCSSPLHAGKPYENGADEIRDILSDLTSRLDTLSIKKNRVVPKVDLREDLQKPVKSQFGTTIQSETHKLGTSASYDLSSDSEDEQTVPKVLDHVIDFILSGPNCVYKLPGKIAKILYPHQLEGLKWLWSLHCKGKGGILGDDMGLGKTMQICSFLVGLFHEKLVRRVLVVAPKTLLTHWINELSTVGLAQKTREYFANCPKTRHYELQNVLQDSGILLTTYDIVRNNVKSLCGDQHYTYDGEEDKVTWDYMILDEGHLIKNPSTQRAKSLLQIPCLHRIIISGTPLQNNLKELWALFNFCCPELLGDKKEFKERYENFINRGNEKNASDREKRIGSSVAGDLRDLIQPYFLRRLKSEVFRDGSTLSKKNEMIVWLRLTRCQRQLYEAFLNSEIVISACDGSPLAALTILKKICDHPLLLTKRAAEDVLEGMDLINDQEDHLVAEKLARHIADFSERFNTSENHDISCKISFILSLLGDLVPKGHNVLIFSQTRKMLNLIQESLTSNHYKYMRIDGTTKSCDRAKLVKDFQDGHGAPIFLLTSQVGGLGITLTNADRVIVVDPAWNPSTDNQSVDRAYRIGQKKDVIVYRLMTCSTVEEKIYRKQVFKGGLFRSATENKEQIRYFSQQDLHDLFSLPKQGFDISLTQQQLLEEHDDQHKMEESMRSHVEFLETLNIAGVSQHSLLFSRAAFLQAPGPEEQEEVERIRRSTHVKNVPPSRSRNEPSIDGGKYAFNPKEVSKSRRNTGVVEVKETSEDEIKESITRLSRIFENKVAISKLADKGAKLKKQIDVLRMQLNEMRMAKSNKENVIEL